jgi:hypothetical protein
MKFACIGVLGDAVLGDAVLGDVVPRGASVVGRERGRWQ